MELIQEFKNYLLSQKKQPSKATVKNYVADVKKFITWTEAKLNRSFLPQLITHELIQDYKTQQANTFSASSLDRQVSSLRKFFEFLKLEGKVGSNPFEVITIKQPIADPWHLKDFKDYLYVYNASHLTIKNYIIDVKQFFAWAEQVVTSKADPQLSRQTILSQVDDRMIEEYSQRLLHEGNFSPASINRKLSSLRKYLTWAHDQALLSPGFTTLPANNPISLLNEAGLAEENTNTGIDSHDELTENMMAEEVAHNTENLTDNSVKIDASEAVKTYSKIPPVRLFQKLAGLGSVGLDYAVIIPITFAAAFLKHRLWILKGKPLFTRTDVKLPQLQRPFKSHVKNLSKHFYSPWSISIAHFPWHKKVLYHLQYTRPSWYRRYSRLPAARYFNLAILMIFCAMIGFGLYSSFFSNARKNPTLAALPTAPPRVLSFQGRLTDNNDNPITTANTHLRFAIYNDSSASGSALLWQEVQDVNPDTDGDFATILGNKTTIPLSVFSQNNALWLGVTVENTSELTPRQQIATVAFATNAETLQGLPPITQTGAGTQNVVLALDSGGNLGIAASTTFQSTSGSFTLSGNTLVLNTNTGSNGNITLAPDGSGTIDLQKPLQNSTLNNNIPSAAGSVEVDDLFSVLATSSGQSAFTLNQNSTGPLISASTSGVAKFTVDNSGNVFAAGNVTGQTIYAGGGTSYYINNATSSLNSLTLASNLTVSGNVASNLIPSASDTYDLGSDPGASGNEWRNLYVKNLVINGQAFAQYWQLNSSVLSPAVITNDFAVGGNSTSSAKFQVFATSAGAQPAGTASTSGNLTFNGATNPAKINLLNGTSLGFYSATTGKGDAGLGSTPTLYVANGGSVGVGTNTPNYSLDVTGNLRVTTAGGFGGALPGATVQGQTSALAVTGYTGLGGLRVNGANTTDTIYNGTSNIFVTRDTGGFLGLTQTSTPAIGLLVNTTTGGVGINTGTSGIGNGQLVINQSNISGLGDVIAASAAGATVFRVDNSGNVIGSQFADIQNTNFFLDPAATGTSLEVAGGIGVGGASPSTFKVQVTGDVGPNANNAYDLGSFASNLQWRNVYGQHIFANGIEVTQLWQENLGALSPLHVTDDLLLGATSTTSARFAVTNIAGGTPVASLSAGTNSGTFLTADGTLATKALQSLTLGNSTTGNISLGTSAVAQSITIGGTLQTGITTLGQSTASNTINIGSSNTSNGNIQTINIGTGVPTGSGKDVITIGNNNNASSLSLIAGSGNMTLSGTTNTAYTIGDTNSIGALTLGQSTAGQAINIGDGVNSSAQQIQIANGASGANSEVDILSGVGTAGTATLKLGDNKRIATIDVGNVAPDAARTITIAGGNASQNDTVNILAGAPSGGTQTVNILSGNATSGTQAVNIGTGTSASTIGIGGSGASTLNIGNSLGTSSSLNLGSANSTTTIKGTNFTNGSVAYTTSNTLGFTGAGSSGQCLLSNGSSAPTWGLCTFGNGNYWNLQQGALFPINSTLDFLIGGNSTSSAKFAVTSIAAGIPQASVSATATGTGITMGGDGSIQSLINGTLTIGGNSTGNIVLKPLNGTGTVTLSGYATGIIHSTSGLLSSSAINLNSGDVTSILPLANGGTGNGTFTNGDMLYYNSASSTTALTKLAIGADNSILNVDSTTHLPKWTSTPTLSGLTVTGTTTLATIASSVAGGSGTKLDPTTNGTLDLGDSSHYFGTVYANNIITPVGNGTQGFWQLTNDVISPVNSFYDLVIGGSATGSATPWQVFSSTVGIDTAGTATSSGGLTFRNATQIAQLGGSDLVFKTSPGGDAGLTPVLTVGGNKNVTVANDLAVNGSNLTSTTSTFNLLNANVSTLNIAGVASSINIGRGSSTTSLNGNLVLGTTASGDTITVNGTFSSTLQATTDNTYDLGSNTSAWRRAYLNNVFADAVVGTQGYWQVTNNGNVITPAFNWQDLGLGGTGTSSATFQVYGSNFTINSPLNSGLIPSGTATTSGFLTFRGGATPINLLNNSSLGFYTSVGGDSGISGLTSPALFISNKGNSGFIGIGTNTPLTALQLVGSASVSANLSFYGASTAHTLNILQGGSLNIQRSIGGDTGLASELFLNNAGSIGIGTTNPLGTLDVRGNFATTPVASVSGSTTYAALVANNDGNGDIFTASSSGWSRFTIANDGTIKNSLIPNLNNTYNLGSDPGLGGKEWDTLYVRQVVTPGGNLGSNYWQLSNTGQLAPAVVSNDLVIGGNSTSSAKFQVFAGSYAGQPAGTASISGNLTFNGAQSTQKINLLNGAALGIYQASTGQGDTGLSSNPAFYVASNGNIQLAGQNGVLTSPSAAVEIGSLSGTSTPKTLFLADVATGSSGNALLTGSWRSNNYWGIGPATNSTSDNTLRIGSVLNGGGGWASPQTLRLAVGGTVGNSALATLDVQADSGTLAVASASGSTSFAAFVADNSGPGDVITASTSGLTRFVINQNGNVGIGPGISTAQGILDVASGGPTLPSDLTLNQVAATNLIPNPSFEAPNSGASLNTWFIPSGSNAQYGTTNVATESALFGSRALKFYTTNSGTYSIYSGCIPVLKNTTYDISAYIYRVAGYSGNTSINWQEYSDQCSTFVFGGPAVGTTVTNTWTRVSESFTTGASTRYIQVRAVNDGPSLGRAYFDGFQLERGSTATPYLDGSLGPGYAWDPTGTPNATDSSRMAGTAFAYNTFNSASGIGAASKTFTPTLQLDQDGSGDLIAASASGVTQFKVSNSGVLTTGEFVDLQNSNYFLDPAATGTSASLSGSLTFNSGSANSTENINLLNNNNLGFLTSVGGDAGLTTVMTLTNAGNLGIGTTSPGSNLEVIGKVGINGNNSGADLYINESGSNDTISLTRAGETWALGPGTGTGNGGFGIFDNTQNATRLYISTAGNVGIGTTSPGNELSVNANSSVYGELQVGNTTSNGEASIGFISGVTAYGSSPTSTNGNANIWTEGVGSFSAGNGNFGIGNASHGFIMGLTSGGNVGIGTTNPNAKLTIANNVASGFLNTYAQYQEILFDNGTAAGSYGFGIKNNTMVFNSGAGAYSFDRGASATTLYMDTGGNVGIGTTSTGSWRLNVVGTPSGIGDAGYASFEDTSNNGLTLGYDTGNNYAWIYGRTRGCCTRPVDINNTIYANYAGSVGIGTTSPVNITNIGQNISPTYSLTGAQEANAQLVLSGTGSCAHCELRLAYDTSHFVGVIQATVFGSSSNDLYLNHDGGRIRGGANCITNIGGNATTFCNDYAEYYNSYDLIGPGEIVSPDESSTDSAHFVIDSSKSYDSSAIGVVSTTPAVIIDDGALWFGGDNNIVTPSHRPPVASAGRVPVEFISTNGFVHVGDAITSAGLAGFGMKAIHAGPTVGKVIEDFDPANGKNAQGVIPCPPNSPANAVCGKVTVLLNISWYDPQVYLTTTGDMSIVNQTSTPTDFTIPHYYTLSDALGNPISQMGAFLELAVGNLRAGSVQAQQTITNTLAVATDNVSIAGVSLHDYIVNVVNQVLQNTSGSGTVSPIADFDQIHTDLISPLASSSAIALDLQNSTVSVKNTTTHQIVAGIDNAGNATFSGTLNSKNLAVNGDATISGTLHVNQIQANSIAGLQEVVSTLSAQNITNVTNIYFATPSGTPNGENSTTGSPTSSNNYSPLLTQSNGYTNLASFSAYLSYVPNLHATTAMFDDGLISLGPTTLTDTSVTGTLSIDNNLTIADNSINVLGADLQIQPFKQGGVSFESGLVAIDTNGNLTVNGKAVFNGGLYATTISPIAGQDLNIQLGDASTLTSPTPGPQLTVKNASGSGVFAINQLGDIVASGAANISKLNFNFVQAAQALSDTEVVATGSAGTTQINQYQTQVTIDDPNVTANSLIYITPVGTTDIPYLLRQVPGKSFSVGISGLSNHPVPFNWLIVN